jgi:WD40 repeat protein
VIEFTASGRGDVRRLSFSPDGRYLAVWAWSDTLSLHDTSNGRACTTVWFEAMRILRPGANRNLGFWGGLGGRTLFAHSANVGFVPCNPDGQGRRRALQGSTELIEPAFALDGTRAVSRLGSFYGSSLAGYTVSADRVEKAWVRRPTDPVGKLSGLQPFEFLPDGDRFLVLVHRVDGIDRTRMLLCRWSDKADRVSWAVPKDFHAALMSPDGSRLLCWNKESGTILAYQTGDPTRTPEQYTVPEKLHLLRGAYHPSGTFLAAGNGDEVIFLDARTFRVMRAYDWRIGPVDCVAFSPDGTLAAVSGAKLKVVMWDVDV